MNPDAVVQEFTAQLLRKRRYSVALLCASSASLLLTPFLGAVFSSWAIVFFALAPLIAVLVTAIYLFNRSPKPTKNQVSTLLDDQLILKDRLTTLYSQANTLETKSARDVISSQATDLIPPSWSKKTEHLSALSTTFYFALGLLLVIWCVNVALLFIFLSRPHYETAEAKEIEKLLEENLKLPPSVEKSLREIAQKFDSGEAINDLQNSLEETRQAITEAKDQDNSDQKERPPANEVTKAPTAPLQSTAAPSATPTATPTPTPKAKGGNNKERKKTPAPSPTPTPTPIPSSSATQEGEKNEKSGGSDKKKDDSKEGKEGESGNEGQTGEGRGKEGENTGQGRSQGDQSSEKSGDAQGKGSGAESKNRSEGDNGADKKGETKKQQAGSEGDAKKQGGGDQKGLDAAQKLVEKLERDLQKQGSGGSKGEKQTQPGQSPSQDSSANNRQEGRDRAANDKKPPSDDSKKEGGEPAEKKPTGAPASAGKERADPQRNTQGGMPSHGENSPDLKDQKRPQEQPKREGPSGAGLGDKKGFSDVQVGETDEKLDTRYGTKTGEVAPNATPALSNRALADVTLAKPSVARERGEQYVPIPYQELLK